MEGSRSRILRGPSTAVRLRGKGPAFACLFCGAWVMRSRQTVDGKQVETQYGHSKDCPGYIG